MAPFLDEPLESVDDAVNSNLKKAPALVAPGMSGDHAAFDGLVVRRSSLTDICFQ